MMHFDPICGRRMNPNRAYAKIEYDGEVYYLCCPVCQSTFETAPEKYVAENRKKIESKKKNYC